MSCGHGPGGGVVGDLAHGCGRRVAGANGAPRECVARRRQRRDPHGRDRRHVVDPVELGVGRRLHDRRRQLLPDRDGAGFAGRTIRVQLWDAAEGATELRIKKPTGTNTWVDQAVDYSSTCTPANTPGASGSNVTAITNGGGPLPFNGCLLDITFTVPADYSPPPDNSWWRVQYAYSQSATDRTTWSAAVIG